MPSGAPPPKPRLLELLIAFAGISVASFGGALPWSRRMIVENRRWMSAEEFNEAFAFAQFLPGPNTVNFAVVFGSRFAGPAGALVALAGLLGPPVAIIIAIGVLYSFYGDLALLGRILAGISAAAAGLLIAMAAKMAVPLFRRGSVIAPAIAAVMFVAVGPFHLPLQWVLLVMAPVSIALAWVQR
jgi:chromate transporter